MQLVGTRTISLKPSKTGDGCEGFIEAGGICSQRYEAGHSERRNGGRASGPALHRRRRDAGSVADDAGQEDVGQGGHARHGPIRVGQSALQSLDDGDDAGVAGRRRFDEVEPGVDAAGHFRAQRLVDERRRRRLDEARQQTTDSRLANQIAALRPVHESATGAPINRNSITKTGRWPRKETLAFNFHGVSWTLIELRNANKKRIKLWNIEVHRTEKCQQEKD